MFSQRQSIFQHEVQLRMATWFALENKYEPNCVFLALEICKSLQRDKSFDVLEMFLNALPENVIYSRNEDVVRAKISVAFERRNYQLVYDLMKVCRTSYLFILNLHIYSLLNNLMLVTCEKYYY